jgi:PadR family transcriptional regulator PadR
MQACDVRHFLGPCLLLLLQERSDHGYDLIERLRSLSAWEADAPTVYRCLRGLEREGLIRSHWVPSRSGPARRRYDITMLGREALRASSRDLRVMRETLDRFLFRHAKVVAPAGRRHTLPV